MKRIPLYGRHGIKDWAIVDSQDFERLSSHRWHKNSRGYAVRHEPRPSTKMIMMHRVINGTPHGTETDHINGNKLDNRRANLRDATHAENGQNAIKRTSEQAAIGTVYHGPSGLWAARIQKNGRRICLGYFPTRPLAAAAYRQARSEMHGKYAYGGNHG